MKLKKVNKFLLIYISVCVLVIALLTIFSNVFYFSSRDTIVSSVESRLVSNLKSASILLDDKLSNHEYLVNEYFDRAKEIYPVIYEGYDELIEAGKSKEEAESIILSEFSEDLEIIDEIYNDNNYLDILDMFKNLQEKTEVTGIYTLYINDSKDKIYFVVDTDPTIDPRNKDLTDEEEKYSFPGFSVGDLYLDKNDPADKKMFDVFLQALTSDEPFVERVKDDYGTYFTGFQVIKDGDEVIGILCVDLLDGFILENQRNFIITVVVLELILLSMFVICGIMVVQLLRRNDEMRLRIEQMAYYDSLTSLPNRASLMTELYRASEEADLVNPKQSAAFFIDLDNFKKVNDTKGHLMGDKVLKDIASYLKDSITANMFISRPGGGNVDFVARLGGDEFILLLKDITEEDAVEFAKKLLDNYKEYFKDNEVINEFNILLSIGIKLFNNNDFDPSEVLRNADEAMYKAKRMGKGCYFLDK